jgi:hypothetical protein
VGGVGGEADAVSAIEYFTGATVMDRGRGEEGQAAVMVLGVVPGEERTAHLARVFREPKRSGTRAGT